MLDSQFRERRPHPLCVKHEAYCTSYILVVPTPETGKSI